MERTNESESQQIVSAYRTIRKFIVSNLLVLILINLQEVVHFNTGNKMDFEISYYYSFTIWLSDFVAQWNLQQLFRWKKAELTLPAGVWMIVWKPSRQVEFRTGSSPCNILTCLRKSLSRWPTTGRVQAALRDSAVQLRRPFPSRASEGTDAAHAFFLFLLIFLFHSTRPRPGGLAWEFRKALAGRAMYRVITELPVYPRVGDRGDLLGKVIRQWRGC